jgi:predicted TPR repeat methyltransferase
MSKSRKGRPVGQGRWDGTVTLSEALQIAVALHRKGETAEAETLYNRVLAAQPDQPDALHFLGVLHHQRGQSTEAVELIARSLTSSPDQPGALTNLGNILVERGQPAGAAEAYRKAIALEPGHAGAHSNLGLTLRALGCPAEAEMAYRRAIELAPAHPEANENLGNLLVAQGRAEEAIAAFWQAVIASPKSPKTRRLLAMAYDAVGETGKALDILREWLAEEPSNPIAAHMYAACSRENVPQRASDAYIEQTFDIFADSFDSKLTHLEYRAPELVAAALARHVGAMTGERECLDAGCGTGLCGPLVSSFVTRLVGVDLSSGMLAQARKRGVYHELAKAELTEYLLSVPVGFDIVISADTLVYFGALERALSAAAAALRPGGFLIFTLEEATDPASLSSYRINSHGRYSHGRGYVQSLLDEIGLVTLEIESAVLRQENLNPVDGMVVSARRLGE